MEIECEYEEDTSPLSEPHYTCWISSALITKPNQKVKSLIGKHEAGKDDHDVESIEIRDTNVHYMPRGLNTFFKNLTKLEICFCGLKEISREDLDGLENVSWLGFYGNDLKMLPDDLLVGMKNLKWINFSNNKLEFVSSELLQPVLGNHMSCVSFLNNPTINAAFDSSKAKLSEDFYDLHGLMQLIDKNCKKPPVLLNCELFEEFNSNFLRGFKDLWSSKRLSDFTIIVGEHKFQVHKNVLMIQSKFFDETFNNEGNSLDELKIEDLSASAVEEVLRWMYTGQTPDIKNACECFALAMRLKISDLSEIAEDLVLKQLGQENAIELLMLGNRFKSEKLKESAFIEIKKFLGRPDLNESLKNLPERIKIIVDAKKCYEEIYQTVNKV